MDWVARTLLVMPTRTWPEPRATRVPYWVYSDPELFEAEQRLIFGGPSWSYVALECEIPDAGDYVRTSIGTTPVVVVRDKSGGINVFVNRCAHRGLQFCPNP